MSNLMKAASVSWQFIIAAITILHFLSGNLCGGSFDSYLLNPKEKCNYCFGKDYK
jgi:hypothetical protein